MGLPAAAIFESAVEYVLPLYGEIVIAIGKVSYIIKLFRSSDAHLSGSSNASTSSCARLLVNNTKSSLLVPFQLPLSGASLPDSTTVSSIFK